MAENVQITLQSVISERNFLDKSGQYPEPAGIYEW